MKTIEVALTLILLLGFATLFAGLYLIGLVIFRVVDSIINNKRKEG